MSIRLTVFALFFWGTAFAGELFLDLSFQDALVKAQATKKLVFIDFYTTWCGPCKMLDKDTWKDEKVRSWLQEHCIPLKIDAEKELDLAKKYKVQAYPTLIFINPDGQEADRIVGYRNSTDFLEQAAIAIGSDPLTRVMEAMSSSENPDPSLRLEYGQILARKDRPEEAMAQFKLVMKEPMDNSSDGNTRRLAIREMRRLGKSYKPSQSYLESIHTTLTEKVMGLKASDEEARFLLDLNSGMRKRDANLEIFNLYHDNQKGGPIAKLYFQEVSKKLLDARRFEEMLVYTSLEAELKTVEKMREEAREYIESQPDANRENAEEMFRNLEVRILVDTYQLALGIGNQQESQILVDRILKLDQSETTYNALAWAGYMSGSVDKLHLDQAKKANELAKGQDAAIIDTLARVLGALGNTEQAISILDEALSHFTQTNELEMLQSCKDDLEAGQQSKSSP